MNILKHLLLIAALFASPTAFAGNCMAIVEAPAEHHEAVQRAFLSQGWELAPPSPPMPNNDPDSAAYKRWIRVMTKRTETLDRRYGVQASFSESISFKGRFLLTVIHRPRRMITYETSDGASYDSLRVPACRETEAAGDTLAEGYWRVP